MQGWGNDYLPIYICRKNTRTYTCMRNTKNSTATERFSISWTRVLPFINGTATPNQEGIDFYRSLRGDGFLRVLGHHGLVISVLSFFVTLYWFYEGLVGFDEALVVCVFGFLFCAA